MPPTAIESRPRPAARSSGYRVRAVRRAHVGVSAERGYLRETGNLVFHTALIGVLVAVGIGGGFGYTGQKVVVEGQTFVNVLGRLRLVQPRAGSSPRPRSSRTASRSTSSTREVRAREPRRLSARPIDYTADVTDDVPGAEQHARPGQGQLAAARSAATQVYLLGNGYAPVHHRARPGRATSCSPAADARSCRRTPTSPRLGVIKVPDGLAEQLGMLGFFYPTRRRARRPARSPRATPTCSTRVLTLQRVHRRPRTRRRRAALRLHARHRPADPGRRPRHRCARAATAAGRSRRTADGLGTVTSTTWSNVSGRTSVPRFASLDIHHDPSQGWVLLVRDPGRARAADRPVRAPPPRLGEGDRAGGRRHPPRVRRTRSRRRPDPGRRGGGPRRTKHSQQLGSIRL